MMRGGVGMKPPTPDEIHQQKLREAERTLARKQEKEDKAAKLADERSIIRQAEIVKDPRMRFVGGNGAPGTAWTPRRSRNKGTGTD